MNFTPQADNRRGLYFGATQSPSKDLEIGAFQQVLDKWAVCGTLADMRMVAASLTLAECHENNFAELPDFWTGAS
eukprot:s6830_g7.t1